MHKGRVYVTGAGELGRLSYILHCPIYDLGQKEKDTSDRVIEETIENIVKECDRVGVEWLVVPAMGSFWAGQTRRKVAQKWCEKSGIWRRTVVLGVLSFLLPTRKPRRFIAKLFSRKSTINSPIISFPYQECTAP